MKNITISTLAYSLIAGLSLSAISKGSIIVSESFDYTAGAALNGQGTTGSGFSGAWSFTNTATATWTIGSSSLSMAGVASSGNSAVFNLDTTGSGAFYATRSLSSALPTAQTLYGSFLFSINTTGNAANDIGGFGLGNASDTDNTASFFQVIDAYGTPNPAIRAEGVQSSAGTITPTIGSTYIYLYQANAATGVIQGWVLSAAQYANFSGSLDAATLNAATVGTAANGVIFKGSATAATPPVGAMDALRMLGYSNGSPGANGYNITMDEYRISDSSLLEAATTVPEPTTGALGLIFCSLGLLKRSRRKA